MHPNESIELSIEDRLSGCGRRESDAIIYVGTLVENVLRGEFGAIIKALTVGRVSTELKNNREGKLNTERLVGRLEAYDTLWEDLEQFVLDKDSLLKPLEDNDIS